MSFKRSGCWSANILGFFGVVVGSFSSCSSLEQLWSVSGGGGPFGNGGSFSSTDSFNSIFKGLCFVGGLVQLEVVIVVVEVGDPMVVVQVYCCSKCSSIRTLLMWQFGMESFNPFCIEVLWEEEVLIPDVEDPKESSLDSFVDWLNRRLCCRVGFVVWSFWRFTLHTRSMFATYITQARDLHEWVIPFNSMAGCLKTDSFFANLTKPPILLFVWFFEALRRYQSYV